MMEECHISALLGHLGARKMVNLLHLYVFWPMLYATAATFCKEHEVCAKVKDLVAMPCGALQLMPVPPKQFYL